MKTHSHKLYFVLYFFNSITLTLSCFAQQTWGCESTSACWTSLSLYLIFWLHASPSQQTDLSRSVNRKHLGMFSHWNHPNWRLWKSKLERFVSKDFKTDQDDQKPSITSPSYWDYETVTQKSPVRMTCEGSASKHSRGNERNRRKWVK